MEVCSILVFLLLKLLTDFGCFEFDLQPLLAVTDLLPVAVVLNVHFRAPLAVTHLVPRQRGLQITRNSAHFSIQVPCFRLRVNRLWQSTLLQVLRLCFFNMNAAFPAPDWLHEERRDVGGPVLPGTCGVLLLNIKSFLLLLRQEHRL